MNQRSAARWALLTIVFTTALRLVYVAFYANPLDGPDSLVYQDGGLDLSVRGNWFTGGVTRAPYLPLGYQAFIALLYRAAVPNPSVAGAAQVILLAAGTWLAYRLTARELGLPAALVTVVLLCANPALAIMASYLAYEIPLGFTITAGLDLASRAMRSDPWRRGLLTWASAFVIGLGAVLQPKNVSVGLLMLPWLWHRTRSLGLIVVALVALSLGPLALATRNYVTYDRFALAGNLGTNMLIGFGDDATGTYVPIEPPSHSRLFEIDRVRMRAALDAAVRHPRRTLWLSWEKTKRFWGPQLVTAERIGEFVAARTPSHTPWVPTLMGWWSTITAATAAVGAVLALGASQTRQGGMLLLLPCLAFWGISLLTFGDPRFRLPVAACYSAFLGLAIVRVWCATRGLRSPTLERDYPTGQPSGSVVSS